MAQAVRRKSILRILLSVLTWLVLVTAQYLLSCDGFTSYSDINTRVPELMAQYADDEKETGEALSVSTIPTERDGILFVSVMLHRGEQRYFRYASLTRLPFVDVYLCQVCASTPGQYRTVSTLLREDTFDAAWNMKCVESGWNYRAYSILIVAVIAAVFCILRPKLWTQTNSGR